MTTTFMPGALIYVKFGAGKQLARVEGSTKDGRPKVRGYNASRGEWMKNLRTILPEDIIQLSAQTISDPSKGWRVGVKDENGAWVRDERGFVKHEWVPLPVVR